MSAHTPPCGAAMAPGDGTSMLEASGNADGGIVALLGWLQAECEGGHQTMELVVEPGGLVLIYLFGSFRGAWHWDGTTYGWIPAAYNEVQCRLYSAADAAHYFALALQRQSASSFRPIVQRSRLTGAGHRSPAEPNTEPGTAPQ